MPYETQAHEALEAWRQAGRRLAETDPASAEYESRVADCRRAHQAYLAAAGRAAGDDPGAIDSSTESPPLERDSKQSADGGNLTDWGEFNRPF
jgi:hypothetical protein